jgi:MYXO-CTERM domain-containing protein
MKKILILGAMLVATVASYAQGTVTFANATATAITNISVAAPYPKAVVNVALYGSTTLGLPDDSSLTMIGLRTNTLASGGIFIGGTRSIGNAGQTVTLQVRAWSGAFATYEDAVLGADETTLLGKSTKWEQATGGGSNPAQPITGVGRLTPFTVNVTPVPEPSSIALGLLGLGAIALFRRRK